VIFHHQIFIFPSLCDISQQKQIGSFDLLTELLSYLTVTVNGTLNRKSYLNARENWRNRQLCVDYNAHHEIGQIAYFQGLLGSPILENVQLRFTDTEKLRDLSHRFIPFTFGAIQTDQHQLLSGL
jgi:hypothetical protein